MVGVRSPVLGTENAVQILDPVLTRYALLYFEAGLVGEDFGSNFSATNPQKNF